MPSIDKKELERMSKRLDFLYEQLDGQKQSKPEPKDEFSRIQTSLKEQLIQLRSLINKHQNCSTHDVINRRKIEMQIRQELFSAEQDQSQLENFVQKNMANKKLTKIEKDNQQQIAQKLRDILKQIKDSYMQTNRDEQVRKNNIKLDDLNKGNYKKNDFINFESEDEDEQDTDRENDNQMIQEWQKKDQILDDKLDDVIILLDEIKIMNQDLNQQIDIRDKLVADANQKVMKINEDITKQHKQLKEIIKKYREPKKFCMDLCMCLLIVGLISVIIMLFKNGIIKNTKELYLVDSGANYHYDFLQQHETQCLDNLKVMGDFDSVREEVFNFFKNNYVQDIVNLQNQDYTDLEKSLYYMKSNLNQKIEEKDVLVVFGLEGRRIDHFMYNINLLLKFNLDQDFPFKEIFFVDSYNYTTIIKKGKTIIDISNHDKENKIALYPITNPTRNIFTKGLKWNLDDSQVWGWQNRISSSNEIRSDQVEIITDQNLIWISTHD